MTSIWRGATIGGLFAILVVSALGIVAVDPLTRGVYPGLALTAILVFGLAGLVVIALAPSAFARHRWMPAFVAIAATLPVIVIVTLGLLGRDGAAMQFAQAFKLGAATAGFGDLDVTLKWVDCFRDGYGTLPGEHLGCPDNSMNYGVAWLALRYLPIYAWQTPIIGAVIVALSGLSMYYLARRSTGRGQLVLAVAVFGIGWVLLLERANLDVVIIFAAVLLAVLVQRSDRLLTWSLAAVPIWIAGAWKYYPFALVLALLPAIRLRRGWMLIVAFLTSAAAYLLITRDHVLASMGAVPGQIGRGSIATLLEGRATGDAAFTWGDAVVLVLVASAVAWGWSSGRRERKHLFVEPLLAVSGTVSVLISTVVVGAIAYPYRAALLLLAVPMLSKLGGSRDEKRWRESSFLLILVVIAMSTIWNPPMMSLALVIVAAFGFGASLALITRLVRHDPAATAPAITSTSLEALP